ncbi:Short-chain dehydrogenase/reductase like protein [Verticillium longisporum]|nr:Short-chain dehydrogenase/reductase like protein [Verticillium longisporum]
MSLTWDFLQHGPDLRGKVALVTGAPASALETVRLLALRGAKVYMAARTESKARNAISEILADNPDVRNEQIVWVGLNLSDLKTVVDAANYVKANESRLDIVVNNACGVPSAACTEAGWEPNIAISHAGHFTLNNLLLPLLKSTTCTSDADVRIVVVSSVAQSSMLPANYVPNFVGPDALRNPIPYRPWAHRWLSPLFIRLDVTAYGVTKLANAVYAQELQRHISDGVRQDAEDALSSRSIIVTAVHPGTVRTPGMAENLLFAATANEVRSLPEKFAGRFLLPIGQVAPLHPSAKDPTLGAGLWENTQREVNTYLKQHGLGELLPW